MNASTCTPGKDLVPVIVSLMPPSSEYEKQRSTVMLAYPPSKTVMNEGRKLALSVEEGAWILLTRDRSYVDGRLLAECGDLREIYDITWRVHEHQPEECEGEDGEKYLAPRTVTIQPVAKRVKL